ncbi:hypothetical protein pb186bvf_009749 [Paramecium bursaria]
MLRQREKMFKKMLRDLKVQDRIHCYTIIQSNYPINLVFKLMMQQLLLQFFLINL